jgi:hypothetical protein
MRLRYVVLSLAVVGAGLIALEASAAAEPTKVGFESFTLTADLTSEGGGPVTASGVINDTGTDIVVTDTEDTFDFGASGQITVFHSPLNQREHFNEETCEFRFVEEGVYVFGNGTGDWAGYNGSGRYRVEGHATDACDGPGVGTYTITAKGPINLSTED